VASRREPISIICVFSDAEVRRLCLDRSIDEHRREADVEYLPIDNTDGSFPTAGAALNHGAALATNDYLVFVHQDVYLHSVRRLERAAGMLADDPGIGVLGASGITADGELVGRIRDRVILLGRQASRPYDVDSLDELLFMAPRSLITREPLSEAPELAWHAYAVEYGLRARSLGLRVCGLDLAVTHNSLTTNLDRLDVAYAAVAARHPRSLPVRATCGTIGGNRGAHRGRRALTAHRWRYRWIRESLAAYAGRWATGTEACVLGDIRVDIDELMAAEAGRPLTVVNVDATVEPGSERPAPVELVRDGRQFVFSFQTPSQAAETIATWDRAAPLLLTNLELADLRSLALHRPSAPRLLGFRREVGYWLLIGAAGKAVPRNWRSPKARPLGMPAIA
jgi:Glycosyltransferase like family